MTKKKRRVDRHVEAILDDRALPRSPIDDPDDRDDMRMAIQLRAARPGAGQPSEEFIAGLRQRVAAESAPPMVTRRTVAGRVVSRRSVIAAASAVAGAAAATAAFELSGTSTGTSTRVADLTITPTVGEWTGIATMSDLSGGRAVPFATSTAVGFIHEAADGSVAAFSGTCTHQGCLLRLNNAEGRLDCPCHRTAFALDGSVLFHQLPQSPPPLPRYQVRVASGNVEALLPAPPK